MSRLHRLALIALVTLVALAALGCGPRASTSMSVAEQQLLCAPIAEHAAGTFACRVDELTEGAHNIDAASRYRVEVDFRPDGRVAGFHGLAHDVELTGVPRPVPDCVVTTIRSLRIAPRDEPLTVPLTLAYAPGAKPDGRLYKGRCTLTVPPQGP